jgi:predicted DNA-binding transcriptional regulator AlpA
MPVHAPTDRAASVAHASKWLSKPQAGEILGVGRSTVARLMADGTLPYMYVSESMRHRLLRADVEALAAASRQHKID